MEFIDLKAQYQVLKKEIDENIAEVINGSHFILGDMVNEMERELAEYIGVKHAISCSSGTAALQLIYMAYGIGRGDAVFCPDMTFIASIEPACLLGATPVFCDIDPVSYNISAESLKNQIRKVLEEEKYRPKAVVVVDFLGNPADYEAIRAITEEYQLLLIEDAAQAIGGVYKGKKCGSLGDIASTSFFPSKPLGCYGDGGAVFTDDDEIAEIIKSLRVHGRGIDKYHNVRIGINSRLDSIQAAVLRAKMPALDEEIQKRQQIANRYENALSGFFRCPQIEQGSISPFAQYVLITESSEKRNEIQLRLTAEDIPTLRYYPVPLHELAVFNNIETFGETFDNSLEYAGNSFAIPFSAYLSVEDQERVVSVLRE